MSRWNVFNRFKPGAKDAEGEKGAAAAPQDEGSELPADEVSLNYSKIEWEKGDQDEPGDLSDGPEADLEFAKSAGKVEYTWNIAEGVKAEVDPDLSLSDGDGSPEAPASGEHVQLTYQKVVWTDEDEDLHDDLTGEQGEPSGDVVPTDEISLNYSKVDWEKADGDDVGHKVLPGDGADAAESQGNFEIQELMSTYNQAESPAPELPPTEGISYTGLESPGEALDELAQEGTDAAGKRIPYYQWELKQARVSADDESVAAPTGAEPKDLGDEVSETAHELLPGDPETSTSAMGESTDDDGGAEGWHFERGWPSKWEGPEPAAADYNGDDNVDGNDFLAWQRGTLPADDDESLALNYSKVEADEPSPVAPDGLAEDPGDTDGDGLLLPAVQKVEEAAPAAESGDGMSDIVTSAGTGGGPHAPPEPSADADDGDHSKWIEVDSLNQPQPDGDTEPVAALQFPKVEYSDEPSTLLPVSEETETFDGKLLSAQDLQADPPDPMDESGFDAEDLLDA